MPPKVPITDAARRIVRDAFPDGPLHTGAYVLGHVAERLERDRAYLLLSCKKLLEIFPETPAKAEALAALAVMESACGKD